MQRFLKRHGDDHLAAAVTSKYFRRDAAQHAFSHFLTSA